MSLEKCLQLLTDEGGALNYQSLIELSDLTPGELGKFARAWPKVPAERREKVVGRLVEMAEENTELDFTGVFKLCLRHGDDKAREKAIEGLWESEDRSVIPMLVELLKGDSSSQVRASAAVALGKFATLAQDGKFLSRDGEVIKGSLMEVLANEQEWLEVRRRALEAVAPFDTPEIAQYIHWAYESDDINLGCSSLYAMGRTGNSRWLPWILRELQNRNAAMRYEAATACAVMDSEDAAPHLIPLLQDDDLHVQLSAVAALGEIGGDLARKALKRCLKVGAPVVEDAARQALENMQATEDPQGYNYEL